MIKMNGMAMPADVTNSERYLHTPGSFAKQNLCYIQEVGRLESLTPHRCIRENLDSFLVLLVLKGQGSLIVANREYVLKQGDWAFIDCKEHHEHISDEQDAWQLKWVHFNGCTVKNMYDLFFRCNQFSNVYHSGCAAEIEKVIDQLMDMKDNRDLMTELHSNELLYHLMKEMIGAVAGAEVTVNDEDKAVLNEAREYLNENYPRKSIFSDFAGEFNVDVQMFDAKFQSHYGISMEEYVNNRRMLAAKELLRFSIKSIPEIATESGIEDVITMQKMFDEKENMTVEEYRSKWAQWVRA